MFGVPHIKFINRVFLNRQWTTEAQIFLEDWSDDIQLFFLQRSI